MYTIQDVISLSRQLRMRTLLWLIPEALLLACVVVSFILRIQWLTSLISFSLGVVILFSLNMFILPLKHYKDFLLVALHGKTSRSTAAFAAFEEGAVMREGVRFYPLIMQVDTPREGLDERRYFWDANLPKPAWQKGDRITLLSHESMVVSWEVAATGDPLSS
jgi:hypothetical protein